MEDNFTPLAEDQQNVDVSTTVEDHQGYEQQEDNFATTETNYPTLPAAQPVVVQQNDSDEPTVSV